MKSPLNRLIFLFELFAKRFKLSLRNSVLLVNIEHGKNTWPLCLCREIYWFCYEMNMNMMKMFSLGKAHHIFFLSESICMHHLGEIILNFRQLFKLFLTQLMQGLNVSLQDNYQPAFV